MKTAGRENPNHGVAWPHNRAHGAVGQNRSYSIQWAAKQEKFQPKGMCFFLSSTFIERFSKFERPGAWCSEINKLARPVSLSFGPKTSCLGTIVPQTVAQRRPL